MSDFDICMGTGDYPTNDLSDDNSSHDYGFYNDHKRGFDFIGGELICRNCGSRMVNVHPGMMVDRAWCNNCGNEDYI